MKKVTIVFLFLPFFAYAHPHILLKTSLEFQYSEEGCTGFHVSWEFDRFFSVSIINDFDRDGNGVLNKAEVADIEQNAFSNLENYGYFLSVRTGGRRFVPSEVRNFDASIKGESLVYRFFVPLDPGIDDFYLTVFDPTYYCAVEYGDCRADTGQIKDGRVEVVIQENRDNPVFYNPYGSASDTATYKEWKPGLETAYPREVHVYLE